MKTKTASAEDGVLEEIAAAFVNARQGRKSLDVYPGDKPGSLEAAYKIQDLAISRWASQPAGWKVGRITGAHASAYGVDRLAGPIFPELLWSKDAAPSSIPVFENGFAAVEGEIVAILGRDAPSDKYNWTTEEALSMVDRLCAGAEIASSPYASINDDGPLVTISDFGNNFGLIVGDAIDDWKSMRVEDWKCSVSIDDKLAGEQSPAGIPGGPIESLRFLLENAARRSHPIKKGMAICTGAVTGVHEIKVGQRARVVFAGADPIEFTIGAAKAQQNTAAE